MASFNNTSTPYPQSVLSEQIHILDFFFPGLAPATSSLWPLLAGVPSIYSRLLFICGLILLFGRYASTYVAELVETYFTSRIEVPYKDEAYEMLISWVCSQPFARSARASLATVDLKTSIRGNGSGLHANKKSLNYSPCNGRSYFWYKGRLFYFQRRRSQGELGFTREEASLSYFGRNPDVLRELMNDCREHYLGLVKNKTCVFEHEGDRWKPSKSRAKKDVSTVIINERLKEKLLNDVADFLNSNTREWYSMRGLPYQRGYLLYGPPGTGKTSLSISIAGHFDLDVYVLTLSTLSDSSLKVLFAELPQHCIVLLEDVDATGVDRASDSNAEASQNGPQQEATKAKVSLSTLLNVLDGIGSSEGRVLIMTTNHVERLDPALTRPGRVDMRVKFHLADEDMISGLFFFVYNPRTIDKEEPTNGVDRIGKDNVVKDVELSRLAQEFVAKMPKREFSPAEIMSLLLENKQSPRHAIDGVDTWIKRTREEKGKFTRTTSWTLDDGESSDH